MKTFAPAASEVAELIREAMTSGRRVTISVAGITPPSKPESPIAMSASLRLGLTRAEARTLATLMENDSIATMEALHAAIARADDPATDIKLVKVLIHNLRRKLAGRVTIETIRGIGYRLTAASRDKLRKLLAPSPHQDPSPTMNPTTP